MSEQAFDLQEALYQLGDVASDPAAAATALRSLLGQLEGQQPGGQPAVGIGPPGGGSTVVGGEATPQPGLAPVPVERLGEHIEDAKRRAATMGDQDRQDFLRDFVDAVNSGLDQHAAAAAPHLHPRKAADTDEELADLAGRINQASIDPGSVGEVGVHSLAEELNRTMDSINAAHLQQVDDFERRRVQAERERQGRARTQDTTAKALRTLAGQLDPGGR